MKIENSHSFPWIVVNDQLVHQDNARISPSDDGFLSGYGMLTTLKVKNGIPLFLEKHLQRLHDSMKQLQFCVQTIPYDAKDLIEKLIEKNTITYAGIRITVTNNNPLTMVIQAREIPETVQKVSVITVPDERDVFKTLKMTYRVHNVMGMQKAQQQQAQDALFVHNNMLVESTYANIYALTDDGIIITPPIAGKGLNGISRQSLMTALPIQEQDIPEDTTNPLVLVSSLSMRAVEKVNGKSIRYTQAFVDKIEKALENAENAYLSLPAPAMA